MSRYQAALQKERDQDRYDARHYGTARTVGQIGATGAELAVLGPLDAALAGGARIGQAAALLAREQAVLAGGGAALNTGMRAAADAASGHRSSVGDYVGSAVGGAVNGLAATRLGPGRASAVGGAVESGLDDLLDGRPVSPVRAMQAAVASAAPAAVIGRQARALSSALPIAMKGKLGEILGAGRALARGEIPSLTKVREALPSGRHTVPDIRTGSGSLIEAKFGPAARLSRNQKEAAGTLQNFHVFHFLPRDVGALFGFPAGLLGRRTDRADSTTRGARRSHR